MAETRNVHINIPILIGSNELSEERLILLINDIISKGHDYTVHVKYQTEASLELWRCGNSTLLGMIPESKLKFINQNYQIGPSQSDMWKKASASYLQYQGEIGLKSPKSVEFRK